MKRATLILSRQLGVGETANVAAILMGQAALARPELYDATPLLDCNGVRHAAIRFNTIVLQAGPGQLLRLIGEAHAEQGDVDGFVFTSCGQQLSNAFEQYKEEIRSHATESTGPVGMLLFGDEEKVRAMTKRFSLLTD